ncbi:ATP-grasp domain-containing protein [Draconibacterium halophilum]|uniref:ATP-grasp domain-containing protein n=1 Tax=Draconibacterium halophilum TaxID=2706887 RepID=A0A6C0RG32_9BACT|nr:ATP-grasp domain-containing protein [Draconibacterium halophilum]QIA08031.1 ATP-grasp domain-containing protein [Draconibacterium halophilum]
MKVALIYNKDISGVINTFGMQNKEFYNEKTVKKVTESLEKAGHNVAVLDGNKQIIDRLENFMPSVNEGEQMGMIFNMAYGIQGESRYTHIPSMLEMLGLPYVGSSPSGHALALDKVLTKIIWKNNDLPTPDFWVFNSYDEDMSSVKFPVIVKPKMESVSFGLKVVYDVDDLKEAVHFIVTEFGQQALVEQFIRGREFCVGLIGNSPVEPFPVLEIDLEGDPDAIQTVDDKQKKPKKKVCPAHISAELTKKMQKISIEAFNALNLRDFARVDIRLDEDDNIYLLEINSMASLGQSGSYPTAAKVAGYDFESLVNKMLDVASVRYFTNTIPQTDNKKSTPKTSQTSRMRTFVKTRQQRTEKLLKNLVDTDTHVRNVEGVNYCSGLISTELSQLGFTQEVFPQLEVGNILYLSNSFNEEIDFLVIQPLDNRIKLAKHENYNEQEQHLEGTGIWENKGGIAVLIAALQALKFSRNLRKLNIGILLITDSSIDGRYSKPIIQQKTEIAKTVVSLSGASKEGGLILSRSGSALYRLETKLINKTTPENVSGTAMNFNKTLASITDISQNDSNNIIAPFNIEFKSNIFKVHAYGSAGISVRYNSPEVLDKIEQKIKKIMLTQKRSKIYQMKIEGGLKRPAMLVSEKSKDYYKSIVDIAKQIDVRITEEHRWSSADICHIKKDMPIIDGLGPVGEYLPSENERIVRHSLIERALLFALLLLKNK